MNTLKVNKAVAVIVIISFLFSQGIPSGWALQAPITEQQAQSVSTPTTDATATTAPTTSPTTQPATSPTSTDFLATSTPITPSISTSTPDNNTMVAAGDSTVMPKDVQLKSLEPDQFQLGNPVINPDGSRMITMEIAGPGVGYYWLQRTTNFTTFTNVTPGTPQFVIDVGDLPTGSTAVGRILDAAYMSTSMVFYRGCRSTDVTGCSTGAKTMALSDSTGTSPTSMLTFPKVADQTAGMNIISILPGTTAPQLYEVQYNTDATTGNTNWKPLMTYRTSTSVTQVAFVDPNPTQENRYYRIVAKGPAPIIPAEIMPVLQKYYGVTNITANIRAEVNPQNPNETKVIISEIQNGVSVDVGNIVIMNYGGQRIITRVRDMKTGTMAQFNYVAPNGIYQVSSIYRTTCSDLNCLGGSWRSQISFTTLDTGSVSSTATVKSVFSPTFLVWTDPTPVTFTSLSDLIKQATDMDVTAAVASALSSVKNSIGILKFNYAYVKDLKGFRVVITNPNPVVGGLSRMEFVIKRDGSIHFVSASYAGENWEVGRTLFDALPLIHKTTHVTPTIQDLVDMAKINVTESWTYRDMPWPYQYPPYHEYYDIKFSLAGKGYDIQVIRTSTDIDHPETWSTVLQLTGLVNVTAAGTALAGALSPDYRLQETINVSYTSGTRVPFSNFTTDISVTTNIKTVLSATSVTGSSGEWKVAFNYPEPGMYQLQACTDQRVCERYGYWNVGEPKLVTAASGTDFLIDPNETQAISYRIARVVNTGDLSQMSVNVDSQGKVAWVDVAYARQPWTDGMMLFNALHQVPLSANDTQALVNMVQLKVTGVDPDGAIHFSLNGQNYKAHRDGTDKVILEREIAMPDGTVLYIQELSKAEMLSVVSAQVNAADQAAAIAAINALPATAAFYKTQVISNGVLAATQYECAPAKRDFSRNNPQQMQLLNGTMPNPGLVQVYTTGATTPFFESKMFFGQNNFLLSVNSIESTQIIPPPVAALAKTSNLNGTRYADIYYDAQGNVIGVFYYQAAAIVSITGTSGNWQVNYRYLVDGTYQLQGRTSTTGAWINIGNPKLKTGSGADFFIDPSVTQAVMYRITKVDPVIKAITGGAGNWQVQFQYFTPNNYQLQSSVDGVIWVNVSGPGASKVETASSGIDVLIDPSAVRANYYRIASVPPLPPAQKAINDLITRLELSAAQAKDIQVIKTEKETYPNGCTNRMRPDSICTLSLVSGMGVTLKLYQNEFHYFEGVLDLSTEVALIAVRDQLRKGQVLLNIKIDTVVLGPSQGMDQVTLAVKNWVVLYKIDVASGLIREISYKITLPDGTVLRIQELSKSEMLSVVSAQVNSADQAAAIAAINALPVMAAFYKTQVLKGGVLQATQYECVPAKRDFSKIPQQMYLPVGVMPNPGLVQVFVAGATVPFFEAKQFFGQNNFLLSVNTIESMQTTPPPVVASVRTFKLNGTRFAEVSYDTTNGRIAQIVKYNYASNGRTLLNIVETDYRNATLDSRGRIISGYIIVTSYRVTATGLKGTRQSVSVVNYAAGNMTTSAATNYGTNGTTVTGYVDTSYAGIIFDESGKIISGAMKITSYRATATGLKGTRRSVSMVTYASGRMTTSAVTNYGQNGTTVTGYTDTNYAGIMFDDSGAIVSGNLVTTTYRATAAGAKDTKKSVSTVMYVGGNMAISSTVNYAVNGTMVTGYTDTNYGGIVFDESRAIVSGNLVTTTYRATAAGAKDTKKSVSTVTYAAGNMVVSRTVNYAVNGTMVTGYTDTNYGGIVFDESRAIVSGNLVTTTYRATAAGAKDTKKSVSTVTYAAGNMAVSTTVNFAVNGMTVTGYTDTNYAGVLFDENGVIVTGTLVTMTYRATAAGVRDTRKSVSTVTYAAGNMVVSSTVNYAVSGTTVTGYTDTNYSGITFDDSNEIWSGTLVITNYGANANGSRGALLNTLRVIYSNGMAVRYEVILPDGTMLKIEELSKTAMLGLVAANVNAADQAAAIAAINALPATAGFYKTEVFENGVWQLTQYECAPQARDFSAGGNLQQIFIPGDAMPNPGLVQVFEANATTPFFEAKQFFGTNGLSLSVNSKEVAVGTYPLPVAALARTSRLDGTRYADIYFDLKGNVTKVVYYQYEWMSLPQLPVPANAVIFPSTLKHYDAQNNLLREFAMDANAQIVSMTVYNNAPMDRLPVSVKVYRASGTLFSTILYDANGQVIDVIWALPAPVQTYVDQLKAQLGDGYNLKAILQDDGSFLIQVQVTKSPTTIAPRSVITATDGLIAVEFQYSESGAYVLEGYTGAEWIALTNTIETAESGIDALRGYWGNDITAYRIVKLGDMTEMNFVLDPNGVLRNDSVDVHYSGENWAVGRTLFDALPLIRKTTNVMPSIQDFVDMAKINVKNSWAYADPAWPNYYPPQHYYLGGQFALAGKSYDIQVITTINDRYNPETWSTVLQLTGLENVTATGNALAGALSPDYRLQETINVSYTSGTRVPFSNFTTDISVTTNIKTVLSATSVTGSSGEWKVAFNYPEPGMYQLQACTDQRVCERYGYWNVGEPKLVTAASGTDFLIDPNETQAISYRIARVVNTGDLSQMSVNVDSQGKVAWVDVAYARQPWTDGMMLFNALHQVPLSANDTQALVNMVQLKVTGVDPDGAIHFSLNGQNYKAHRDGTDKVILEREIAMPDGTVLYIQELSKAEMLSVVSAQVNAADQAAAIAAINALPATAAFYRTQGIKNGILQWTQYDCAPAKRDFSAGKPQAMYLPSGSMPNPGLIQVYAAGAAVPFFEAKQFFGQNDFLLSVNSIESTQITPPPVASLVKTSNLSGARYADIYYDAMGQNVSKVVFYQYNWSSLPQLQAPANAMVFPSKIKHYGANSVLLRELTLNASGQPVQPLIVYGNVPANQIPATVKVYKTDGTLFSTLSYNTQTGSLLGVVWETVPSTVLNTAKSVFGVLGLVVAKGKTVSDPACPMGGADCKTIYMFYDAGNKLIGKNEVGGIAAINDWYLVNPDGTFTKIPQQAPAGISFSFASGVQQSIVTSPVLLTDVYADASDLKTKLGLSTMTVTVQAAQPANWPDPCNYGWLGLNPCAQVVTPGYKVILQVSGVSYEYHHYTNPGVGVLQPKIIIPKITTTVASKTETTISNKEVKRQNVLKMV
ncbi:MAG TPA: hypothetical protein PLO78_01210 [Candidatus Omnitrophota bacterium]|nr:hypothetical protein [Candidatus Omnitrophota bacterium]